MICLHTVPHKNLNHTCAKRRTIILPAPGYEGRREERMFIIRDREAGNFIDSFDSYEKAFTALNEYEAEDRAEGIYVPEFYEIVEE